MPNTYDVVVSNATATYNSIALPETDGGWEISITEEVLELTTDTHGSTPVGAVRTGQRIEATAQFAASTIDALKTAISGATKVTGSTLHELNVGSAVGGAISTNALVITPTQNTELAITIYKAYVATDLTLMFKFNEKNTYEVKFIGVIDTAATNGERLFRIGTSN
jgi:hypothetical protein